MVSQHRAVLATPSIITPSVKTKYSFALMLAAAAVSVAALPLRASETDDRIEASAQKSYVFKTYLKDDAVKMESRDGVVTLTGTVADPSHKALAQDTVEGLPGVKRVDNQLAVKDGSPAEHSDAWLALKVRSALVFHRNVSAAATDVSVADGVVTLRGEAANSAQKELTAEYAQDVEGVKEVKNAMTVAHTAAKPAPTMGEMIDDASITAQVKGTLLSHRSTSALKTKVSTTDGVVTVSGMARNDAEKSLVTKLASDVTGVDRVVNNMTIAVADASNN